jgi:ribosomal protein L14E/L6E/L27E
MYLILEKQKRLHASYLEKVQYELRTFGKNARPVEKPTNAELKLRACDMKKSTGTKLVFITASPVLTNEVMRYYKNLKKSLEMHLEKQELKREARLKKLEEEKKKNENLSE